MSSLPATLVLVAALHLGHGAFEALAAWLSARNDAASHAAVIGAAGRVLATGSHPPDLVVGAAPTLPHGGAAFKAWTAPRGQANTPRA